MVRNGRCTELMAEKVTREECCDTSYSIATAWSNDDLDPGTLFFWRVLGGGVPCGACKGKCWCACACVCVCSTRNDNSVTSCVYCLRLESCVGVECGEGKRCMVRKGQPKCVCFPDCRSNKGSQKGPVCGTDGRTYRSVCRLRKRACRRKSSSLSVAYYGICQSKYFTTYLFTCI